MLNEFIDALRACPWYGKIFETKYPVIMLQLTGSRLYEVVDDISDYDMIAICDAEEIELTEPPICYTWKGKKVHWSYLPIKLYTEQPKTATRLQNVGLSQFCHLRDEVIIYKNPEYASIIDNLITNKSIISYNGTANLYEQMEPYVNEVCEAGEIDERHYTKMLSHLCRAYFDLCAQPIDVDFLRSIKRIRWQPVPQEYKTRAVGYLRALRDVFGKQHEKNAEQVEP